MSTISRQRALFEELTQDASSAPAAKGGIKHLDYLVKEWMPLPLWKSWSEWGRLEASTILKIPIEGVIPTTNHLESFNAILKRKHLSAHLHSGYRLRFDLLIHLLITRILPGIFHHQNAQHEYKKWLASRFRESAGGHNLLELHNKAMLDRKAAAMTPICWWEADPLRDGGAHEVLLSKRMTIFRGNDADTFHAVCTPQTTTFRGDPQARAATSNYAIEMHRSGYAVCSCPDFVDHGGACKHLRALRTTLDHWVSNQQECTFYYPKTRTEAENILSSRLAKTIPPPHKSSIHALLNPLAPSHESLVPSPPPSVLSPVIAWNPPVIQALGCDLTTLDDQDEPRPDNLNTDGDENILDSEDFECDKGLDSGVSHV